MQESTVQTDKADDEADEADDEADEADDEAEAPDSETMSSPEQVDVKSLKKGHRWKP